MVHPAHLVVAPILVPLVAGALMLFFDDRERRLKTALSLVSTLALISIATALLSTVHGKDQPASLVYLVGNWPAPIAISLVADRLAAVMLLLTALLALPALIFSTQRWERMGPHFHTLF